MSKLEFISATRHPGSEVANTALGRSLRRLTKALPFDAHITAENATGLPQLYNARIEQGPDESILVFVHDDVWVEDFAIDAALADALNHFDIVGVVGNQRRVPGRPTWSGGTEHRDGSLDFPYLSGRVGHSKTPFGKILNLGPLKVPCQMIDGLFIAARRGTLRRAGVQFDPQFSFHFYDMDFCRSATRAGLSIGTWPISLTHQSSGKYDIHWERARDLYFAKWGD